MIQDAIFETDVASRAKRGNPRNSEAATIDLSDGSVLLAWSQFLSGSSDWAAAQIAALISRDGGRTWGEGYVLQENEGKMCTYGPTLLRLDSGNLGLTYFVKNSRADNRVYFRRSADDGRTWSERTAVTPEPAYNIIINDRAVQLSSGRIIAPIAYVPEHVDHSTSFRVFCAYSDDQGNTWSRSPGELGLPKRGAMEPAVIERRDGSLFMLVRTQLGHQYSSVSTDAGESWEELRPAVDLISSEAPACVKRIPSTGDLLVIWNRVFDPLLEHVGPRTPLSSAISRDDGRSWTSIRNIEQDPQGAFAYTSIHFRGQEVLLTYYRSMKGNDDLDLKLVILPVTWFYGGQ